MTTQFTNLKKRALTNWKKGRQWIVKLAQKHPLATFFGFLLLILLVITLGAFLRKPSSDTAAEPQPAQPVEVFTIGATPQVSVQAQVEKSGVIQIVAQSAGVVQKLNVKEGDQVDRGTKLMQLSTNYQGGSLPGLSRQIAQKNYQFAIDNYPVQLEMISQRKEIAQQSETLASDLRDITAASLSDTRNLIALQEEQYRLLDEEIERLEALGEEFTDPTSLLGQFIPARAGALSALSSLRQALENAEYQANSDNPPADLARLQRDLTIKQLELEEKSLNLNQDLAKLNLRISQVAESLLYPASPCPGVVERVYVKVGQSVVPGTLLATITANSNVADLVALVSSNLADEITTLSPSTITINNHTWDLYPRYISTEPTNGSLHAVLFTLPVELSAQLSQQEYVTLSLPLGLPKIETDPYIPVDAVYQSDSTAYVYVVEQNGDHLIASSREVTLDRIMGKYVMALNGLKDNDQVILNRNVSQGEWVEVTNQ